MNSYNILWECLKKNNITKIFGLPGSPLLHILSSLPSEIEWINVGNELQNGFVAQVYGKFSNNVGVAFYSTGPGISTALSAIKNAEIECKPLIVITPTTDANEDFQSWNIKKIGKTIIKNVIIVDDISEMETKFQKAYDIAYNQKTSVMFLINENIKFDKKIKIKNKLKITSPKKTVSKDVINQIKTLDNKKFLVIIEEYYHTKDEDILFSFLKRNNIPYITVWNFRYHAPDTFYCGRSGSLGNHSANYAVYHATHLLLIGTSLENIKDVFFRNKFNLLFNFENKKITIITYKTPKIILENETILTMKDFHILKDLELKPNKKWLQTLQKSNEILLKPLPVISLLERYSYTALEIYKKQKLDINITTDVGNNWLAVGKYADIHNVYSWETATMWASIGIGMTNGIGMYNANNKPVWTFIGDGGFIFSASCFFYLLANKHLPITVFLFVNNLYGAVATHSIIYNFEPNKAENIYTLDFIKKFENTIVINSVKEFEIFLSKNPVSKSLRIILIDLGNKTVDSNVYEIDINSHYKKALKNSSFDEILNTKQVLKPDNS
jgi:acetolactate synthase-1/2/3 large subunit